MVFKATVLQKYIYDAQFWPHREGNFLNFVSVLFTYMLQFFCLLVYFRMGEDESFNSRRWKNIVLIKLIFFCIVSYFIYLFIFQIGLNLAG